MLHSSGAVLKAPQIAFSRDTESRPALACAPLITSVGEPPTPYLSLSTLCILNSGNLPLSHDDWSFRFAIMLNSSSVLVVHEDNFALSIPTESIHDAPSAGVPVLPRKQVR